MESKNYKLVAYYLSIFIIIIGFIQLIPLIFLPLFLDEIKYVYCFLIPGLVSILFGIILRIKLKNTEIIRLGKHYDSVLVVSIWLLAITISSMPWVLSGDYNFVQAAFEMTSGFSTTGLSVCDVDNAPKLFLIFRSTALFVGGVGFVLILAAALNDRYGLNIYNAEGHNDRLLPNLSKGARLIFSIYTGFITFGSIAYRIAGMPWFDAINTSIAALSTGGFSVIGESIYGYHNVAVEIITIVLMMFGGVNFVVHFSLLKRKLKPVIKNDETKMMVLLVVFFSLVMTIVLLKANYTNNFLESLRLSIFQFVSCVTTTGFISVKDPALLPAPFINIMTLAMLIGGNMESTAGGIKQYRVIVCLKGIYYSIKDSMSNSNVIKPHYIERLGKRNVLSNEEIRSTSSYVLLYLTLFFVGSLIFTFYGYNLQDAMYEFSSCISTVGMSLGITNYYASPIILWTGIIGMFLGRLELMIVFQAFIKIFKDTKKSIKKNSDLHM